MSLVLAGVLPALPPARVSVTPRHPYPARSTVTLELTPRLPRSMVAKLYERVRSSDFFGTGYVLQSRLRKMSEEHTTLAVFAEKVNDGRTWEAAMAEWNQQHPKWSKSSVPGFTRAAHQSYERVTGQPLQWQRERGRPERA